MPAKTFTKAEYLSMLTRLSSVIEDENTRVTFS
jgi:hypothetical protein